LPKYLDTEAYAVVLGGVDETSKLLEKQWGHSEFIFFRLPGLKLILVLFTGSGRVGKIVAAAAAKTLTPTTLEVSRGIPPSGLMLTG
jgi:hypothetical protein